MVINVGLKAATGAALISLFALMYAIVFVIGVWFLPGGFFGLTIMIILTMLIVLFQYGISPVLIGWIYRIDWMPFDAYKAQFPHLADVINKVCQLRGVKIPRVGVIHDLNPNAFTYGWTKNTARVIITDGILEHLNKNEQSAVVAHEMGHVVHNDFVLMTVVFAIPLLLLTVARWAFYTARFSGMRSRDEEGSAIYLALFAIAILSYLAYYLGYLISLIVSRVREFYADEHAGEVTENPNYLSTGLVKIAYGLVAEGGYTEAERKQRNRSPVRGLRGLGIFDPSKANITATTSLGGGGKFSKDAIQAAAAWDLFNPWAKYYQMFSTHPLPARRIIRLNTQCEIYGVKPELDFSKAKKIKEEQAGKSMIPEFLTDIFITKLATFVFIIWALFTVLWIFGLVGIIPLFGTWDLLGIIYFWALGFYVMGVGFVIGILFMYKKGFQDKTVLDLVTYVKASPVRCIPANIHGRIIGRGIPGYYFSEDLYFQDETGIMYIDYRFGLSIVDFFFGILKARKLVGQEVKIVGWYRRGPAPYLQVKYIKTADGKTYKNHARGLRFFWAILLWGIGTLLLWVAITNGFGI